MVLISGSVASGFTQSSIDLTDFGWHIWPEEKVNWEEEELHSPTSSYEAYRVNVPGPGWEAFISETTEEFQLPAIVEDHPGAIDLTSAGVSNEFSGISWFYTFIDIPRTWRKKQIILQFEGVEMKAEVYLNERLVGVNIFNGVPFEADITNAAAPGSLNLLAIRITDPVRSKENQSRLPDSWRVYADHSTHGFCGITGEAKAVSRDAVYIRNIFIKNQKDFENVQVAVEIENLRPKLVSGTLTFEIIDRKTGKVIATRDRYLDQIFGSWVINIAFTKREFEQSEEFEQLLWSPASPDIYQMRVTWKGKDRSADKAETTFGFRWFNAQNIPVEGSFHWNSKEEEYFIRNVEIKREMANKSYQLSMDQQAKFWIQQLPGWSYPEDITNKRINSEKTYRTIQHVRNSPSLLMYRAYHEIIQSEFENLRNYLKQLHDADPTRLMVFTYSIIDDPGGDRSVLSEGMLYMIPDDDVVREREIPEKSEEASL